MTRDQAIGLEDRLASGAITGYDMRVGMVTVYLANGTTEFMYVETDLS